VRLRFREQPWNIISSRSGGGGEEKEAPLGGRKGSGRVFFHAVSAPLKGNTDTSRNAHLKTGGSIVHHRGEKKKVENDIHGLF